MRARSISIASSTAWGLAAAHDAGLVHCDFKPGNVLLLSDFTAKVTDFGLSRQKQYGEFASPGKTPLYASPEQANNDKLSSATDFWSWGATCFEMFIGEPTWQSGAAVGHAFNDFLDKGAKFPGFPEIPEKLAMILQSCLSKKPSDRPNSFQELAQLICDLHEDLLGVPSPAAPPDVDLVAADSLNNRAVSHLYVGNEELADKLLTDALSLDPNHPEAIFNYFVIIYAKTPNSMQMAESMLMQTAEIDPFNPTPFILLAQLAAYHGRYTDMQRFLAEAKDRGASKTTGHPSSPRRGLSPVLAKPTSGADYAYYRERFHRIIAKAKCALKTHDIDNAERYIVLAGDVPGFSRHPDLHRLRTLIKICGRQSPTDGSGGVR